LWFPKLPDIFFGLTSNATLFIEQINLCPEGVNDGEYAPKWLQKKFGASFGFGGNLIVFSDKLQNGFNILRINGREELENQIKSFIDNIEKTDKLPLLEEKINNADTQHKRLMWSSLKYLVTSNNNELFKTLGYDKTKLQTEVFSYLGKQPARDTSVRRVVPNKVQNDFQDFEKVFDDILKKKDDGPKVEEKPEERTPMTITETISKNINWNLSSEKLIKDSLLIGDLEHAVDVSMKCGRDAEALLIASTGPIELFNKVKNQFFSKNKDLFIKNIFSSIINKNFDQLLEYNIIKDWKEYVLYSLTYLAKQEFVKFASKKLFN
jgi:protein transport protein SEC31